MEGADLISTSQTIYLPSDFPRGLEIGTKIFLMQNEIQPVVEPLLSGQPSPLVVMLSGWNSLGEDRLQNILQSGIFGIQRQSYQRAWLNAIGGDWGIMGSPLAVLGATSESFYQILTLQSEPRLMPAPSGVGCPALF